MSIALSDGHMPLKSFVLTNTSVTYQDTRDQENYWTFYLLAMRVTDRRGGLAELVAFSAMREVYCRH
jgi:hypothetical protein